MWRTARFTAQTHTGKLPSTPSLATRLHCGMMGVSGAGGDDGDDDDGDDDITGRLPSTPSLLGFTVS